MSKKLNIIDAMKMPVGTIFEVFDEDGNKDSYNVKVIEVFGKKDSKKLVVDNRAYIEIVVSDFISNATFIPTQQPVSFMEAIKASQEGKTIRVYIQDVKYTYYPKDNKFLELSAKETRGGLSTAEILDGKWYIEESEDN